VNTRTYVEGMRKNIIFGGVGVGGIGSGFPIKLEKATIKSKSMTKIKRPKIPNTGDAEPWVNVRIELFRTRRMETANISFSPSKGGGI
jgi:hypothetical protein